MKGKDAPSKRTLLRVNSSVDQIEKRRHDLEEWVWALLTDSEISRSHELAAFLELQAAAGGNQARRCVSSCCGALFLGRERERGGGGREREGERQSHRERERERQRQRQTDRQRKTERGEREREEERMGRGRGQMQRKGRGKEGERTDEQPMLPRDPRESKGAGCVSSSALLPCSPGTALMRTAATFSSLRQERAPRGVRPIGCTAISLHRQVDPAALPAPSMTMEQLPCSSGSIGGSSFLSELYVYP